MLLWPAKKEFATLYSPQKQEDPVQDPQKFTKKNIPDLQKEILEIYTL
jgi:hypothetical protein